MVDPAQLILNGNSRIIGDIAKDAPGLCKSVAEHGVLVPLIANPGPDGRPAVRDGFSRTLAALRARETNPTVPVLITDSQDEQAWTRLQEQFVINHERRGYTEANKAAVYEQMSMFGFGADEIADRLGSGTSAESVQAGLTVRANKKATKSLEKHPQLTLEQAAGLVEFQDDAQATKSLHDTLEKKPEQIDHTLAQLRQSRAFAKARTELIAELEKQGVKVVHRSYADHEQKELRDLRRSREDNTPLDKDPQAHAQCPGHAAWVPNYGDETPKAIYLCTAWKKNRHIDRYGSGGGAGHRTEEEKAAMRTVRENNRAGLAAQEVRRAFVRKLVARKTPPARAHQLIAAALLADDGHLTQSMRYSHNAIGNLFGDITGIKSKDAMLSKLSRASANDAVMAQLIAVLAAYEASMSKDTWRRPSADDQRYLAALKTWGYTLAPVEELIVKAKVFGSPCTEAVTGPRKPSDASAKSRKATAARSAESATPSAGHANRSTATPVDAAATSSAGSADDGAGHGTTSVKAAA